MSTADRAERTGPEEEGTEQRLPHKGGAKPGTETQRNRDPETNTQRPQ